MTTRVHVAQQSIGAVEAVPHSLPLSDTALREVARRGAPGPRATRDGLRECRCRPTVPHVLDDHGPEIGRAPPAALLLPDEKVGGELVDTACATAPGTARGRVPPARLEEEDPLVHRR
jgi:hypothetical protein